MKCLYDLVIIVPKNHWEQRRAPNSSEVGWKQKLVGISLMEKVLMKRCVEELK